MKRTRKETFQRGVFSFRTFLWTSKEKGIKKGMIPKSRYNWIIRINAYYSKNIYYIHLPMFTQMRRMFGSPKMIPFTTIFESVGYPLEKSRVSKEKGIHRYALAIVEQNVRIDDHRLVKSMSSSVCWILPLTIATATESISTSSLELFQKP